MRHNYWSCSAFADIIRGTPDIKHGTNNEFTEWRTKAITKHPIRYWIAEEVLDSIQDVVYSPIDLLYSIKYYIKNRYITKSHCLTAHPTRIKPGKWCDVGDRFLPCLFNELVDFVEIEIASMQLICIDEEKRSKYNIPKTAAGWVNLGTWRCKDAAFDHLDWAKTLVYDANCGVVDGALLNQPTPHALAAIEIKELYLWWTEIYPNRPDPSDESGLSAYYDIMDTRDMYKEVPDKVLLRRLLARMQAIEDIYTKEDEEMMIRLIKIRDNLWT